jgi:hypothetical protein
MAKSSGKNSGQVVAENDSCEIVRATGCGPQKPLPIEICMTPGADPAFSSLSQRTLKTPGRSVRSEWGITHAASSGK